MNKNAITSEGTKTIYIIRALALIGIVSAHCAYVLPDAQPLSQFFSHIIQSVGAVGVGVFFFLSGFLFRPKKSLGSFLKKRVKTIFIPWLFCSTLVYLYVALRKGGTVIDWALSVLGYMSSYWYMTVLVFFFILYYFIHRHRGIVICTMILSLVSAAALEYGLLQRSAIGVYLNPFNWMLFFASGILLQNQQIEAITGYSKRKLWPSVILTIIIFCVLAAKGLSHTYFSILYIPIEILAVIATLGLSDFIAKSKNGRLILLSEYFGKRSFSIYLLHELGVAGVITWAFNKFDLWWTIPLRPLIVILLTAGIIEIGYWLAGKIHVEKTYAVLIGERR